MRLGTPVPSDYSRVRNNTSDLRKLLGQLIVWWAGDLVVSYLVWATAGSLENLAQGSARDSLHFLKLVVLILINVFSVWKTAQNIQEHLSPHDDDL